ncbi:Forkhead box protein J1 [Cichlidogyrus casuarinus]|uniref:Forkhead box protein J1 n=1 Tax=Cichlidogyrus casuarinus TaxID=1844966 RepID=A0ABD2QNW4_9PLAT
MFLNTSNKQTFTAERKSEALAEKLRENWVSKQSEINILNTASMTTQPKSVTSERDDSLTNLNWLQSLNLTKMPHDRNAAPMTQHPYYAQYFHKMQQQSAAQHKAQNVIYSHQRHVYHNARIPPLPTSTKNNSKLRLGNLIQQQKLRNGTIGCIQLPFLLPKPSCNAEVLSNAQSSSQITITSASAVESAPVALGPISIMTTSAQTQLCSSPDLPDALLHNVNHLNPFHKRRKVIPSISSCMNASPLSTGVHSRSNSAGSSSLGDSGQAMRFMVFDSIDPDERKTYRIDPHVRPPYTYSLLMFMAFDALQRPKVSFGDLCKWICEQFAFYRYSDPAWQNAMRLCLSHNSCFHRVHKRKGEHDGGWNDFWRLSQEMQDLAVKLHEQAVTTTTQSSSEADTPVLVDTSFSPFADETQQAVDQLTNQKDVKEIRGKTEFWERGEQEVDAFLKAASSIDRLNPTLTANQWTVNGGSEPLSESMTNFFNQTVASIHSNQMMLTKGAQVDGNNNTDTSVAMCCGQHLSRLESSLTRSGFGAASPPTALGNGIMVEIDEQGLPWVDDQLNLEELDSLLGLS